MNVLYYLREFPKLSESFVLNEIYELDRAGHDVAVCALYEPEDEIVHQEFDELEVPVGYIESPTYRDAIELLSTRALHPRILRHVLYPAPPAEHLANLYRAKRGIEFVEDLEWDPDHVHTHFAMRTQFPARYIAAFYGTPVTITTHANDLYSEPIGRYTSSLLRSVDRIVTVSEYNRQYIRDRFTDETPIDLVRAGIRPEKFLPNESPVRNRVLTVGRFVEKKGLTYALEAIDLVSERLPDTEYHIVGSGRQRDALERKVETLGLGDTVTFLGNVDDEQLLAEYAEARCFLLPCVVAETGDRDGVPVALMEAMAMKTPPVSTTVSGIPELVEHETNGLLTAPRDPDATAAAVVRLLRNDEEWARYRTRAHEKIVSDFNVVREVEKLERSFEAAQSVE